ncbi:MAG: HlyC/CorC family transporter [Actinobacteria bacterium]|nr:HlyC/CorC family transporter [Actinomycetota bacterium]
MEIFEVSFESSILIILLLLFAGLLAGSESALTSLSRLLIEEIVEAKPNYKIKFQNFVANPAKFLNVLLLVRKSCELTATATVAVYFVEGSSNKGLALFWAIALMVAISYVVVGVGPRTLGKQRAIKWARLAITIAVVLSKLLGPLTTLLIGIGNALTPGKGFKSGPFSTEAEFRDLVDQASESGFVEESEREMIHSVFDLGETLVRELMVPRTEMVWIEADKTVRQGLSLALRSGFTRIPVISENLDNVVGIAYVKDLAKRVHDNPNSEVNEKVEEHLRKATFVPENKTADDLLKQMQRDQIHMAIVVDEYGGTAGIITIEDILEEIVGEIADEYDDNESEEVEWLNENKARISARLHVEDFAEKFDSSFTDEEIEDVDSIGGLIAKHLGRVPIPGSTITVPGWKLTAERPSGRRHRIATVLVEKIEESGKISDQL